MKVRLTLGALLLSALLAGCMLPGGGVPRAHAEYGLPAPIGYYCISPKPSLPLFGAVAMYYQSTKYIEVIGSGFGLGRRVTIYFDNAVEGVTMTDCTGSFRIAFLEPCGPGRIDIYAVDTSGHNADAVFYLSQC